MKHRVQHSPQRRDAVGLLTGAATAGALTASGLGLSCLVSTAIAQTGSGLLPSAPLNPPVTPATSIPDQITPRDQRELLGIGSPRIALLLPPRNGDYVRIAQALRNGFVAGHQRDARAMTCEVLDVPDRVEDLAQVFSEFKQRGIGLVVGPLTRNGVNCLIDAQVARIPTLALNLPDIDRRLPDFVYSLSLAIEGECRQLARLAYDESAVRIPQRRPLRASVVQTSGALQKRAANAFAEQWRELGGELGQILEQDPRAVSGLRSALSQSPPDAVFIAAAADAIRSIKNQLPRGAQAYASSLSNPLTANPAIRFSDLEGVRLTELPLLVQGEHSSAAGYPRAPRGFTVELQRLFALGVDAYRLASEMLANASGDLIELDGVSGRLRLNRNERVVERLALLAESREGQLRIAEIR